MRREIDYLYSLYTPKEGREYVKCLKVVRDAVLNFQNSDEFYLLKAMVDSEDRLKKRQHRVDHSKPPACVLNQLVGRQSLLDDLDDIVRMYESKEEDRKRQKLEHKQQKDFINNPESGDQGFGLSDLNSMVS